MIELVEVVICSLVVESQVMSIVGDGDRVESKSGSPIACELDRPVGRYGTAPVEDTVDT
jgi:hypothetical protein